MESRFYRLSQFLGGYLHEDWPEMYGTPERAVDVAIAEYPIELRQQVRRELATVIAENPDPKALRDLLNDGLGVNIWFKKSEEARAFADRVESELIASIKTHFEGSREQR